MGTCWQQIPFLEKRTIKLSSFPSCWQKSSAAYPANAAALPVNISKGRKAHYRTLIPFFLPCFVPYFYQVTITHAFHSYKSTLLQITVIYSNKQNHVAPLPSNSTLCQVRKKNPESPLQKKINVFAYLGFLDFFSPLCYWGMTFEGREGRFTHVQIKVPAINSAVLKSKAQYSNNIPSTAWSPTSAHTSNETFFKEGRIDPQQQNG